MKSIKWESGIPVSSSAVLFVNNEGFLYVGHFNYDGSFYGRHIHGQSDHLSKYDEVSRWAYLNLEN